MSNSAELVSDLKALNKISQTLNRAVDVRTALESSLHQLVKLMGLETGWIFIHNPAAAERWAGRGFELGAYVDLPPALAIENNHVWDKGCNCQTFCTDGKLDEAYNEVRCSRLAESIGDRRDLGIHATTPLKSGSRILGILNVVAKDWESFDDRSLTLLTTVGDQMGVAMERALLHDMLSEQYFQEQSALLALSQKLLKRSTLEGLETFIVSEARRLLDVDACALLLPDPENQNDLYFLAEVGWRTNPVEAGRRVPTTDSKVGKVMIAQKPLVAQVEIIQIQTVIDEWSAAENFKSIAAVPLVVDGRSIGVLVVHSRRTRQFGDSDLRFLNLLANQAAIALEAWRLVKEEIEWGRTERELAFGREIQQSMLPENCPKIPGWQFSVAYEVARKVGGDFYDFFPFLAKPELWGIVIADVSDKGVPAALYMVLSRTTIRNTAQVGRTPAKVLQKTNRYILEDSQADMFLSAFYATLDTTNGLFTYSNAGHNHPLWWQSASKQLVTLSNHGILLGVVDNVQLDDHQIVFEPGDLLILYTDGITEAINEAKHEFGEHRLKSVVKNALYKNLNLSGDDLVDIILKSVADFTGERPQFDDRTLLIIKCFGYNYVG